MLIFGATEKNTCKKRLLSSLSIYIYIYMCVCVCAYVHIMHLFASMDVWLSISVYKETVRRINIWMQTNYIFTKIYIYIYIYIYCHPQTDCFVVSLLFSVVRHAGRFKLGWEPAQHYARLSILLLSLQSTYVSSGIIRNYVLAFVCLLTGYQSAQFIRRALHYASGNR